MKSEKCKVYPYDILVRVYDHDYRSSCILLLYCCCIMPRAFCLSFEGGSHKHTPPIAHASPRWYYKYFLVCLHVVWQSCAAVLLLRTLFSIAVHPHRPNHHHSITSHCLPCPLPSPPRLSAPVHRPERDPKTGILFFGKISESQNRKPSCFCCGREAGN